MKYGLIVYKGDHGGCTTRGGWFNVGDNIQMKAMKRIYIDEMKISKEDIVEIDYHELGTYDGEYIVVPINFYFSGCSDAKECWFPASPKIIPVFIGVHFSSNYMTEREVAYFRTYAPIGCRDAYTLKTMRKYNIPAYLFGCITATLPKRPTQPIDGRTYIVDVDDTFMQYIPERLKKNANYTYHEEKGMFIQEKFDKMDRKAEYLLKEYYWKAGIVITSRLHCASPCVAMGIPTVMVVKEKSSRFAWLDRLIPIYTVDEAPQINWDVDVVDFEPVKMTMCQLVCRRLREAMQKWTQIYDVSAFFEEGVIGEYVDPNQNLLSSVDTYIFNTGVKNYIIWGTTAQAEQVYQHILKIYPQAHLVGVIDLYNKNSFHGYETVQVLDILKDNPEAGVIVTPSRAKEEIMKMLLDIHHRGVSVFYDGSVIKKR